MTQETGDAQKGAVDGAISRLTSLIAVPDGMVLVPREQLSRFRSRLWDALRSQQQDVKVNGANHPGLLEPMAGILESRLAELDAMIAAATGGA